MTRQRRVVVVGRGVVCGFGAGEEALWRGLLSGETAIGPCPELAIAAPAGAAPPRAARAPDAALGEARAETRCCALVCQAARQLGDPGLWGTRGTAGKSAKTGKVAKAVKAVARLGLCLGTTQGEVRRWEASQIALEQDPTHRPGEPMLGGPTSALAEEIGADGPVLTLSMACASGTAAVAVAAGWIRQGLCELAVAGGVDVLSPMVFGGFAALRALDPARPRPFDVRRAGLGVGEGAALLLLRAADGLTEPGQEPVVEVLGCGLSSDAHHLTGPDPEGRGLAKAIQAALCQAELPAGAVEAVNAHGTATVYNDLMEAKALRRALGDHADSLPVDSIKGAIGHTMAAAGAIEAVLCAGVLERGLLPATCGLEQPDAAIALPGLVMGAPRPGPYRVVLSTSSGFGGINAALLLGRSSWKVPS